MLEKYLLILTSWIYFTQGATINNNFQKIRFLPPTATSFASRTDHFITKLGFDDSWLNYERGFLRQTHITPDFSNGLAYYSDPFLQTGSQAKQLASLLYNKELFFQDIPHERALIYNQHERRRNGLEPHELGSLRADSPWFRF